MTVETQLVAAKRHTREEVQRLVAEFVSREFLQESGLSFGTLDRHLKKQRWKRRSRAVSSAGRWVPVELAARKSPTQREASCGWPWCCRSGAASRSILILIRWRSRRKCDIRFATDRFPTLHDRICCL